MSRELLTDDSRPVAGFFGKLPATGDFVARGLPDAFRRNWDAWISREVAPVQRDGLTFPPGGLRFRLVSGGHLVAGVILPSEDSAGRLFPLSLLLIAEGALTQVQIDGWCDAALGLTPLGLGPDALWLALDEVPAPEAKGVAEGTLQLWTPGQPTLGAAPDAAGAAIRTLLKGAHSSG